MDKHVRWRTALLFSTSLLSGGLAASGVIASTSLDFGAARVLKAHGEQARTTAFFEDWNEDGLTDVLSFELSDANLRSGLPGGGFSNPLPVLLSPYGYRALFVADLDGDGHRDLLRMRPEGFFAELGNGDGTFRTGPVTASSAGYIRAAVADWDLDGHPDLAILQGIPNSLVWRRGLGGGAFASPIVLPTTGTLSDLVAADWDSDGKPDLIVAGRSPDIIRVLRGNGDGTFRAPIDFSLAGDPRRVLAPDLDGDSRPDLLIASGLDTIVAARRAPLGPGFTTSTMTVHPQVLDMTMGDIDGDGIGDVIARSDWDAGIATATLSAVGAFRPTKFHATSSAADFIGLGAFDADRDGRLDIGFIEQGHLSWLRGDGRGDFGAVQQLAAGASFLSVADLDGDGHADVLVLNNGHVLSSWFGDGNGGLHPGGEFTLDRSIDQMQVADFDGDGFSDLLGLAVDSLVHWKGTGTGEFLRRGASFVEASNRGAAIADFDGDGVLDLLLPTHAGWRLLHGNGDVTFGPYVTVNPVVDPYFAHVATGDFNRDGIPDCVGAFVASRRMQLLLGRGDGTFDTAVEFASIDDPYDLQASDVDSDGNLDLVSCSGYTGTAVGVQRGRGDGTFEARIDYESGEGNNSLAIADFDGDGMTDIVTAVLDDGFLSFLHGTGGGKFEAGPSWSSAGSPERVVAFPAFHDRPPDLLVVSRSYSHGVVRIANRTLPAFAGVSEGAETVRLSMELAPNPSRARVRAIVSATLSGAVQCAVFDAAGRHIRNVRRVEPFRAGQYVFDWDGLDGSGARVRPGAYFMRAVGSRGAAVARVVRIE